MTQFNPTFQEAYNLLHEGILALSRAEQQGICVNVEYVEKKKEQLTKKIKTLEEEFYATKFFKHWAHTVKGKINIYSNTQLGSFLCSEVKPLGGAAAKASPNRANSCME